MHIHRHWSKTEEGRDEWRVAFEEFGDISEMLVGFASCQMACRSNVTAAVFSPHFACLFAFTSPVLEGVGHALLASRTPLSSASVSTPLVYFSAFGCWHCMHWLCYATVIPLWNNETTSATGAKFIPKHDNVCWQMLPVCKPHPTDWEQALQD